MGVCILFLAIIGMFIKDYTKFYMISESFTIHPTIWGQLDQEDKDNMSI